MAVVYAQNITEVALVHTIGSKEMVNVLHLFNDEGVSSDADAVRDLLNNWQDHIIGNLDGSLTLVRAEWRSLDPDDTNQGVLMPDPAKPSYSGLSGTGAAANTAYLVRKVTANRQRGQRDGRIFIPGVRSGTYDETGAVDPGFRAALQASVDAFLSGVNDTGAMYDAGQYLAVLNTTPASRAPGTQEVTIGHRMVTSLVVDARLGTQRERMR